jgi:hypothetical protein
VRHHARAGFLQKVQVGMMDKFEEATTNSGNVQQAATLKKYRVLTKCAAREAKVNGHQVILKYRSRALATTSLHTGQSLQFFVVNTMKSYVCTH